MPAERQRLLTRLFVGSIPTRGRWIFLHFLRSGNLASCQSEERVSSINTQRLKKGEYIVLTLGSHGSVAPYT